MLALAALTLAGAAAKTQRMHLATATIVASRWPYLPGSVLPLHIEGIAPPYSVSILGPGRLLHGDTYAIPAHEPGRNGAFWSSEIRLGSGRRDCASERRPSLGRLLLVASYDEGLVLHDERSFSVIGVLATGGVPSDVAVDRAGEAAVHRYSRNPADARGLGAPRGTSGHIGDVPFGDEVAADDATSCNLSSPIESGTAPER